MTRYALLAVLTAVFFLAVPGSVGSQTDSNIGLSPHVWISPGGAVEGGDAIWLPHGDIINVRNVQGGTADDPNLDIGAGSSLLRGTLSFNYDVGRCAKFYDGHKRLLMVLCPGKRPWFKYPPRVGGNPPA